MRILLLEDDKQLGPWIAGGLREEGHVVDHFEDGKDALMSAMGQDFDLLILDRMVPGLDGLSVLKSLRASKNATPALFLTALGDVDARVEGFEAGGDDYLTKPFAPKELSARIRALLRRARPGSSPHARLVFGDLELVPDEGKVLRGGDEVHLTKTEFRLLCELADNPGKVFSREALLDKVWGYDYFGDGRLVDVHVRRLRTKIEADPANPRHVVTVRGLGYRLQT